MTSTLAHASSDELIHEMVYSLAASAFVKPDLTQLTRDGLAALKDHDRCLEVKEGAGVLNIECAGRTMESAFPPKSPRDVVAVLDGAIALVTPPGTESDSRRSHMARSLAASLRDPWTAYIPPSLVNRLDTAVESRRATPGIALTPKDPARIREVRPGSPAAQEALVAGDRIVQFDGQPINGWTMAELSAALIGPSGSVVRLVVRTAAGETRKVFVKRTLVPEEDVRASPLENGVLYLRIAQFAPGIARRSSGKIWERNARAVILDMRHNPGGFIQEGVALLDLFFSEGSIGGVQPRQGRPSEDFTAGHAPTDSGVPLAVLIDGSTASAAEFVTLVLKDRKRAVVLGTPSLGKGSVQKPIRMPDKGLLKITSAKYMGPNRDLLPSGGVMPHRLLGPPRGRTVLEGGKPAGDSWVLAALDALDGVSGHVDQARSGRYGPQP